MSQFVQGNGTRDVRLFASIAAMGIEWSESGAVEGGDRAWLFEETSDCGLWSLRDLLSWWQDSAFHVKHGDHPFHAVKATMASDKSLRSAFRNHTSFRQERKGSAMVIVPSAEERVDAVAGSTPTMDTAFAAAAAAVGFPVTDAKSEGRIRVMEIGPRSVTRDYTFAMIDLAWKQNAFEANNPQHPFAYAKAVAITYMSAIKGIKKDKPLVRWSPDGSVGEAYIHPDCSSETEAEIASCLKGE
jgi:hypothetical protein